MQEFKGVYKGFSPTDESPSGLGEIEITIGDEVIRIRMATGRGIHEEEAMVHDFVRMSAEETRKLWKPEAEEIVSRTVGFCHTSGPPQFFFLREPKGNEFGLFIITGGLADILGPTILFNPQQVEDGVHEKVISSIEQGMGAVPRLAHGE